MATLASRRLRDYGTLMVALVLGGYATWNLRQPWANQPGGNWFWIVLVSSGLIGGYALAQMEGWLPDGQPAIQAALSPVHSRRMIGAVCLFVAIGLTVWIVWRLWPDYHTWDGAAWLWLVALASMAAGGMLIGISDQNGISDATGHPQIQGHLNIPRRFEVIVFATILGLAIVLRVYRLDQIPAAIWIDETNGALDALHILEGHGVSPFGTGWYGTPGGYLYYMASILKLFGANWYSLKLVSLIPAILTIPAVYLLGRRLFGQTAALSAMLLVAVSRWHLTLSRWGWNELVPPLFLVLAVWFLIRGLRGRRALDMTLAGLVSGLMMYTYLSSRLSLVTVGVFILYWLLVTPGGLRVGWRAHWPGLVLFGLAWAVAVAPIAVTHITDPATFFYRMDEISVLNEIHDTNSLVPLENSIIDHLRAFHQVGDHSGRNNLPGEPQLDPLTGVLFVIGLGHGLWRWRDWRRGLLWLWLLLALANGFLTFSRESPHAYRTLTAVPAVALLAGDVLARLAHGLVGLMPAQGRVYRAIVNSLAGLILASAWAGTMIWNADVYFGRQAQSPAVRAQFSLVETEIGQKVVAALRANNTVYLSADIAEFSPVQFLAYGATRNGLKPNTLDDPPYHIFRPETDLPLPDTGGDVLLISNLRDAPMLNYWQSFYRNSRVKVVNGPDGSPSYVQMRVPHQDIVALQNPGIR